MPKTTTPSKLRVGKDTFTTNAVPDPFDERDLVYRPRLEPLPYEISIDSLRGAPVLKQQGDSCTGHALATAINAVIARSHLDTPAEESTRSNGSPDRVSPYMLYWLARRYDEFPGTEDEGSSLRGALKGWFHHGVCAQDLCKYNEVPKLDDDDFRADCRRRPLGAFYRVMPYRLDDMQSAISELHAIVASARVHEGWREPVAMRRGNQECSVITHPAGAGPDGAHAFAIVGYNAIGFWVQNSWGKSWGDDGYAVLPYEDWLDNAYDAWVVRPGVPATPFTTGRTRAEKATNSILGTGKGPNLSRLDRHVVNIGSDGGLSSHGEFASSPEQIQRIVERMEEWHEAWLHEPSVSRSPRPLRHVVLYAPGGLTSEEDPLRVAERHLNWWLNNRVYPIYFAWQSGAAETLLDRLVDLVKPKLPPSGVGFDLLEQFDRLVEKLSRESLRWIWREMKESILLATAPARAGRPAGAATEVVNRLAARAGALDAEFVLHLVGHGAGAIFLAELLPRIVESGLPVFSLSFLAPALRVDAFAKRVLPALQDRSVRRCAVLALSDSREADDTCGVGGITAYNKSLLYLVSRTLEQAEPGAVYQGEIPLLGMEKFLGAQSNGSTVQELVAAKLIEWIASPAVTPAQSRTNAHTHYELPADALTMGSVMMRIRDEVSVIGYEADLPLAGLVGPGVPEVVPATTAPVTADTHPPGTVPVDEVAQEMAHLPLIPASRSGSEPEVGIPVDFKTRRRVRPRSHAPNPTVQSLQHDGWSLGITRSR